MLDPASSSTRHQGRVTQWQSDKGFGFAEVERSRIFIHIRDFSDRRREPKIGDTVSFVIGADAHGRACAKSIQHGPTHAPPTAPVYGQTRRRLSLVHAATLFVLLVLPILAIYRLQHPRLALWFAGWVVASSGICYFYYAWDKRRAQNADWRLPENMLHVWALLGGWPGGYLAQRKLRHKSAKLSFLFVFWAIVISHQYIALDSILDWRLTQRASLTAQSWMDSGINFMRDSIDSAPAAPTRPRVY